MDVCVCATLVPFTSGGAELLVTNLVDALTAAGHRVATVALPVAWDRGRLLDTAAAWRMLPLDFDLVIATNFPSYFAQHPRKVVWLLHQHRAAYDGIDQPWSDFTTDELSHEQHRQLVQWDTLALAEAERVYTISDVVTGRLARFNGLAAQTLYHPPPLAEALREGPFGDAFVCVTRLERNKRPELFVEAFGHTTSAARGELLGRGSLEAELRATVAALGGPAGAPAVEVAGFVPDAALVERLARARAVVYTPYDEDYGYATLQAFQAGKPVITTADAGGVLEWVEDGVTGFVVEPTAAAVAEAIDRLAGDAALAERLGAAGRARVARLSWRHVVTTLVGSAT